VKVEENGTTKKRMVGGTLIPALGKRKPNRLSCGDSYQKIPTNLGVQTRACMSGHSEQRASKAARQQTYRKDGTRNGLDLILSIRVLKDSRSLN